MKWYILLGSYHIIVSHSQFGFTHDIKLFLRAFSGRSLFGDWKPTIFIFSKLWFEEFRNNDKEINKKLLLYYFSAVPLLTTPTFKISKTGSLFQMVENFHGVYSYHQSQKKIFFFASHNLPKDHCTNTFHKFPVQSQQNYNRLNDSLIMTLWHFVITWADGKEKSLSMQLQKLCSLQLLCKM